MYPREKGADLSLCWYQPSIITWCIYPCVGGGLPEHWEAWSSRGHGAHSLVRSIKHRELAFRVGNWAGCLSSSPHSPECHVESWLKIHTQESLMHHCIFHWGSLWQAFPRSTRTLLWRLLRQLPILQASFAGGRETVSTCNFKGKPGSFCDS